MTGKREHEIALTGFGFTWGPCEVQRAFEVNGQICIRLLTDAGHRIDVYVSQAGRSVRVWRDGKKLS